jgi:hypothetical protein
VEWHRGRVFSKEVGTMFLQRLLATKEQAMCVSVSTKEKFKPRPLPLNTVALLKIASTQLNMGPQQTMRVAEHLYTSGYLSYPRTETSAYPPSFDLNGAVAQQRSHPDWGSFARDLLKLGLTRPKEGDDKGDHPPITPMRCAHGPGEVGGGDAWRLYEYVCRHFLATVSPDAVYETTTIKFQVGEESFEGSGRKLISGGFTLVMPWLITEDQYVPAFVEGAPVTVAVCTLAERDTAPPEYLTESELIGLMEHHSIGSLLAHFFECISLVTHWSDSNFKKRTLVLQTALVMNIYLLIARATHSDAHIFKPRSILEEPQAPTPPLPPIFKTFWIGTMLVWAPTARSFRTNWALCWCTVSRLFKRFSNLFKSRGTGVGFQSQKENTGSADPSASSTCSDPPRAPHALGCAHIHAPSHVKERSKHQVTIGLTRNWWHPTCGRMWKNNST